MAWSNDAAPTRANIRKRIDAARAALNSATHLLAKTGDSHTYKAVTAADAWAGEANNRLSARKGKRVKP